jgi:hypothetical protein
LDREEEEKQQQTFILSIVLKGPLLALALQLPSQSDIKELPVQAIIDQCSPTFSKPMH